MNQDNTQKKQNSSVNDKPLYIITGATGAMGKVIAKRIASQGNP